MTRAERGTFQNSGRQQTGVFPLFVPRRGRG
uniref:Uncharacterized protein n=1 Tax=Anguilla anguilla TaxID=7936 RepID=A0A0E9P9W0_ANGAN